MLVGIVLGIVAFVFASGFVQFATHSSDAAFFPGLVGSLWAAWPLIHKSSVERKNFLHPAPREYADVDLQRVFSTISNYLREERYNFGDQWRVDADPAAGRISADLKFSEEEDHPEFGGRAFVRFRTKRVQRFLGLVVWLEPTEANGTIVRLEFDPRVEGFDSGACDTMIRGVHEAISLYLGPGELVGTEVSKKLPGPPTWLLACTVAMLFFLFFDVSKAALRTVGWFDPERQKLEQSRRQAQQEEQDEFDSWKRFKESQNL
jgi:hypothetical protein